MCWCFGSGSRPTGFLPQMTKERNWQLILSYPWFLDQIIKTKLIRLALNFTFCHYSVIPAFYLLQKVMSFVCQFDATYENETFFYTFPSSDGSLQWNSDWTEWLGVIHFKVTKSNSYSFSVKGIFTICKPWRSCFEIDMRRLAFYQHITKNVSDAFYTLFKFGRKGTVIFFALE